MMLTRCPACQTVFRLRPEQLHARRGEVRCGHCFHPFNALEHALERPEGAPPMPTDALAQRDSSAASGTAANRPGSLDRWASAARPDAQPAARPPAADFLILEDKPEPTRAPPSTESLLELGIPEVESGAEPYAEPQAAAAPLSSVPPSPVPIDLDTAFSAQVPATDPGTFSPSTLAMAEPVPGHHAASADDADAAPVRVFPGVLRSGRRPPPPTEPLATPSEPQHLAHELVPSATAAAPAGGQARGDDEPTAAETASPEPDLAHLDATYGRPPKRTHPVLAALGGMLAIALAALLGAQTIYLYRMEIARELPGLRPLLTEACMRAGCTVPYPQDADRIAIEASDLQAEPGRPGHYLLHTTLNNRAEYPQQWPQLELTLTDAGDNPMSRRVLAPAEWLPAGETGEAFPARKAIEVRLPFQVEGQAPTGYRIYAFYP
ncbi:MAG: DUF3426 domain-containing protein [Thauera sp.]